MKIGIDARFWGLEHAGLGRYLMELVGSLSKIDRKNRYALFLRKPYVQDLKLPRNFEAVPADILHYSVEEQWLLSDIFSQAKLDLLHVPHFNVPLLYRKPFVVTIHDLLWHDVRGLSVTTQHPLVYVAKYIGYRMVVNHALKKAKAIMVPSLWIRKKLMNDHGIDANKITVTYEAPSAKYRPTQKKGEILRKYGIQPPFVIYTGSAYPHKNIPRAAMAVKILNDRGMRLTLVICSARSVFLDRLRNELQGQKTAGSTLLVGFVPDEDLTLLYSQAEALVQPSLSEGFGLTGLEAMACDLPVVASECAVFKEIYANTALYADSNDPKSIANKLERLIKDPTLRRKLIKKGRERVRRFSWERLARRTLAVYQMASQKKSLPIKKGK